MNSIRISRLINPSNVLQFLEDCYTEDEFIELALKFNSRYPGVKPRLGGTRMSGIEHLLACSVIAMSRQRKDNPVVNP